MGGTERGSRLAYVGPTANRCEVVPVAYQIAAVSERGGNCTIDRHSAETQQGKHTLARVRRLTLVQRWADVGAFPASVSHAVDAGLVERSRHNCSGRAARNSRAVVQLADL